MAITAAFDRDAASKARGGEFVGPIATHFIPPGIKGFEEAGGEKGPGFDFLAEPQGDMAVAEKYMKDRPGFREYCSRTSFFIPRPPRLRIS